MEKIHISFMKDLFNIEFGGLYKLIAEVKLWDNIDNPSLKQIRAIIKEQSKELVLLRNMKLRHPLTEEIQEKMRTRNEYLRCLRMRIEAAMLSHRPEERIAAKRLILWMRSYRKEIYTPNTLSQATLVQFLLLDREFYPDVQQATTLLGLDELINVITELVEEIRVIVLKRNKDKLGKSVESKALRKVAFENLKLMINAFEFADRLSSSETEKTQIEALVRLINCHLKEVHTTLKSRITKRKNKKEREKEAVVAVNEIINDSNEIVQIELLAIEEKHHLPVAIDKSLQIRKTNTVTNTDKLKIPHDVVDTLHARTEHKEQLLNSKHNTNDDYVESQRKSRKVG